MLKTRAVLPKNEGWLEVVLPTDVIEDIDNMIENAGESVRDRLAGNISNSQQLTSTESFEKFIQKVVDVYQQKFDYRPRPNAFPVDVPFVLKLNDLWVNYQYQTEFNPSHTHAGVFSFVIWRKIPTDARQQLELPFAKNTTLPCVSCFQFEYMSILGNRKSYNYAMSPQMEGMMVFFPAALNHLVYPFYGTDDVRISVAGNLAWIPDK